MGRADFYSPSDYNCICDACGKKVKASELKLRWDGFRVCQDQWEPRHPQDFVRGVPDQQAPPWTRPVPTDQFIDYPFTYDGTNPLLWDAGDSNELEWLS